MLFDPNVIALHHKRASKDFSQNSFLFDHVAYELIARLEDFKRTFFTALNLSPRPLPYPSDQEAQGQYDLILSCLHAHWVNDLPGFLKDIYQRLQPDGLFLGALWGGQTLCELRECLMQAELALTGGASARVAPMIHPTDAPTLLSRAGFFMPVVDTDTITVTYPSLVALMKDLRGMGETNKLNDRKKNFTSRALFEKAEEIYLERYGKITATFEVIFLTGWKKILPPKREEGVHEGRGY